MIYDVKKKPMANRDNSLTVISCNTCFLPEGLARGYNLPFVEERLVHKSYCLFTVYPCFITNSMSANSVPKELPIYVRPNILNLQHLILR